MKKIALSAILSPPQLRTALACFTGFVVIALVLVFITVVLETPLGLEMVGNRHRLLPAGLPSEPIAWNSCAGGSDRTGEGLQSCPISSNHLPASP